MGRSGLDAPAGLTDDPAALAAAARAHLRDRFFTAKVGISGANFLIADTGGLVIVESEGNGRMCLTLPETLISVVGVEKILPDWKSLGVFLQLLPRSSTGERMNPYTSIFTGVTPGDGPSCFHLVLLDNGRTSALADPDGREVLRSSGAARASTSAPSTSAPAATHTGIRIQGRSAPSWSHISGRPRARPSKSRFLMPRPCAERATKSAPSRSTSRGSWSSFGRTSSTQSDLSTRATPSC